ncbi:uncharacterized protein LOC143268901 isoform X1 [Peromyscus maniculatus bairdii]|uniref:uncharacterized protein LOC143268901 isoform X1 n=1 Tax=Peromyscus maniculatus bairdii TaxID=230844 RepID=UPI003FD02F19
MTEMKREALEPATYLESGHLNRCARAPEGTEFTPVGVRETCLEEPCGQECSCDPAALGQQPPDTELLEEHPHPQQSQLHLQCALGAIHSLSYIVADSGPSTLSHSFCTGAKTASSPFTAKHTCPLNIIIVITGKITCRHCVHPSRHRHSILIGFS